MYDGRCRIFRKYVNLICLIKKGGINLDKSMILAIEKAMGISFERIKYMCAEELEGHILLREEEILCSGYEKKVIEEYGLIYEYLRRIRGRNSWDVNNLL